ncbi:hypothetical protein DOM22_03105 [Bdellovibrio sp. ZAP7]|uniref:hypothetical protein n=1 Tax=Bdellovibrio sp. ZAP7 TaxID=2231053 RepID=UPI0011598186|nr:hypothetical protein [Bdellovibrio sp. ZAP7]QDK44212.1 hypothetical protein DOM22_03105 [Bdellovibrio sp. ZAP7]
MSRYHEPLVYTITIAFVAGIILIAEKTKGPATGPVAIAAKVEAVQFSQSKTSSLLKPHAAKKGAVGFDPALVLLDQEVEGLYKGRRDWKQREPVVRAQMENLSMAELTTLAAKAVDTSANMSERQMSVYLLSLAGLRAHNALFDIVKTPFSAPKAAAAKMKFSQDEMSLRVRALQALDQMAFLNPAQLQKTMKIVMKSPASPQLKNYAQISLNGITHGQPGKLSHWLNQTVASAGDQ